MSDSIEELIALRREYDATAGRQVLAQLEGLHRTMRVFEANWHSLETGLHRFKTDTDFAMDVLSTGNKKLDPFLLWLDPHLHNFLASVQMLVDHTRIVKKRTIPDGSDEDRMYKSRTSVLFVESPRSQFVQKLRDYLLHYQIPSTGAQLRWQEGGLTEHGIYVDCTSLLQWKSWNATSREFIFAKGGTIDLHEALDHYQKDAAGFYKEFRQLVFAANREAIASTEPLARRINALVDRLRPLLETP